MKPNAFWLALAASAASAASALAVDKPVPEAFNGDRYQSMIAKSPFALATPVAPPVTADKSFADGWFLAGVAQIDGKNFVTVRSRDQSVNFTLHGDERREDNGVKLANVEWSPIYGRTSATIEKDGQFAKVELSPDQAGGGGSPMGAQPPGPMPRPALTTSTRTVGGVTQVPGPAPQRNIIPRPSGQPLVAPPAAYPITKSVNGNPTAQPTNPAAPAAEGRRRIRMINSAPTQ